MGNTHQIAVVAAGRHAKQYYNHTGQSNSEHKEDALFAVLLLIICVLVCGALMATCTALARWCAPYSQKPEEVTECHGVYTISTDTRLNQEQETAGPPPAYETLVPGPSEDPKESCSLQEVVTPPCPQCELPAHCDSSLPSYEAAVMLRDTKL